MNPDTPWTRIRLKGGEILYDRLALLASEIEGAGVAGEGNELSIVLPPGTLLDPVIDDIHSLLDELTCSGAEVQGPAVEEIEELDWVARWRQSLGAVRAGKHLVILRPGVDTELANTDIALHLEPRMAFGTGDHATTRMALSLLEPVAGSAGTVLDLGCGNGVLVIAALLLGAGNAAAIDNEEESYAETLENAKIHGVRERLLVVHGNAITYTPPFKVDLLLANIFVSPILEGLDNWMKHLSPGARLVLTGVQEGEEEVRLLDGCKQRGLNFEELLREDGWIAARFSYSSA
jgi:ribosomal protein L11 methyltransferase